MRDHDRVAGGGGQEKGAYECPPRASSDPDGAQAAWLRRFLRAAPVLDRAEVARLGQVLAFVGYRA